MRSADLFVVVVAIAVCILAWVFGRLWFSRMAPSHRAMLGATTLRHYTSHAAGRSIDQGDDTVKLVPRPGLLGAVADLAHQNWAGIRPSRRAVYLYAGVPTNTEKKFHAHANDVVVVISGADLLAAHPGHLHCARRDTAIAVRGGYQGPGTVQTLSAGDRAAR
jgi:hypothetical protein